MNQEPHLVEEALRGILVEFGLRQVSAITDTHTVTVEEPSIWDDSPRLKSEVRTHDI